MTVKQVIVIRKKYPDGKGGTFNPRKGKLIAQGAHAAMAWLSLRIRPISQETETEFDFGSGKIICDAPLVQFSSAEKEWLAGIFTKVVVGVETEEELLDIYNKAKEAGLEAHLITDSGLTEFNGQPTHTAVGIGPDLAERIDPITGELELL